MMRVAHVVVAGEVGGAERMLVDLAVRSAESGAEHTVAVLSPDRRVPDLLSAARLRVEARRTGEGPLAFLGQTFGAAEVAWLASVLRRERAEIVHVHTFASQVVGTRAARAAGLPVLRTEHSTRAFDERACWPFARWSLARSAASVAVSAYVLGVASARAPWATRRMRVVANGIDADHFAPSPWPSGGPLRLAIVGRLEPRKGVDRAIEAVARSPGVLLDVVGEGALRPALERLAHRVGAGDRVRFLGYLPDVRPAIAACHAVVCTSRTEGLGLALLEAMAMGRVAKARDRPSPVTLVAKAGDLHARDVLAPGDQSRARRAAGDGATEVDERVGLQFQPARRVAPAATSA